MNTHTPSSHSLPARRKVRGRALLLGIGLALVASHPAAAQKASARGAAPLSAAGQQLEARYAATLNTLRDEISKSLPKVNPGRRSAVEKAGEEVKKAQAATDAAQAEFGKIGSAQALVNHAKGKWIGGAEKGIADAEAALKKATTPAEREAAKQELAKWQQNKEDGLKALKERQADHDKLKKDEPRLRKALDAAKATLKRAQDKELGAVKALLAEVGPFLASDGLDPKLVKCVVLTEATPRGLAEFASQGGGQAALVEKLLADDKLMKEMLIAGGAKFGEYGRAMNILTAIQQVSPQAGSGMFARLALATALEHARPIPQSNAKDQTGAPALVDPVKRYLHYEKAWQDGELDPAFKGFTVWEYRMVVNCDAPDEILAWGREMLRNYRPDHIHNSDYGWRYVASVRTEVPYGSQNVKDDSPALQNYQNIIRNGGVCGRRAFFGRFILRSFGIPTWGVTQRAHAAVSHWTPKGWVVNLGAGFNASWWDKDEVPMSGTQFLLESQAREHGAEYPRVLRAQWIGSALGEQAFNERRKVPGGFWSGTAHHLSVILASQAVTLGPLGQELAEANEPEHKQQPVSSAITDADREVTMGEDGAMIIPAVAYSNPTGKYAAIRGFHGGMVVHCQGGFKAAYTVEVPEAGEYTIAARVATVQVGQRFQFVANNAAPAEIPVPYTLGMWEQTTPVKLTLRSGRNTIHLESLPGSRGVTVRDISLRKP